MATNNNLNINVNVNGAQQLTALSASLRTITSSLNGAANATRSMDANQRALNAAIGRTAKGLDSHAKTVSALVGNQAALGAEIKRVNKDLAALSSSTVNHTMKSRMATAELRNYGQALRSIKARALVNDLRSLATEMKRLGKDAQFTGRSMIIGLTTPIIGFARVGLQSLVSVDKELTRLNKVIEYIAPNIEDAARKIGTDVNNMTASQKQLAESMVSEFNKVDNALLNMARNFGVSRELIIAIAGDFAELGNATVDTTIQLAQLTAEGEKLGNIDMSVSQQFIQSMFQQANRALSINAQVMGIVISAQEREAKSLAAVNAQLAMFNAIENATALSLRDLAQAFPEMAAASTSFGLSMTEAAALLAPMVAAGFEVGASANSIKVSLQRLNAPTKQNTELFKELSKVLGKEFNEATSLGIDALDYLAQAFDKLSAGGTNAEAAMEFMSKIFGVRQGPRFEVAIQELAILNSQMKLGKATAEGYLTSVANSVIETANATSGSRVPVINTFSDIGKLARIASKDIELARQGVKQIVEIRDEITGEKIELVVSEKDIIAAREARKAVGDEILKARREGKDILSEISTQAGRAMFVELAGAASAQEIASQELEAALGTLDAQIQRIKTNFKLMASEIIKALRPVLDFIDKAVNAFSTFFQSLSPLTKAFIAFGLAAVAAIGPLVFAFGQARLAVATLANSVLRFLPGLSKMTAESISGAHMLLNLSKPVVRVGDGFETAASRMSIFIAKMASMNGPIGAMATKIGYATGALKKHITAETAVIAAIETRSAMAAKAAGVEMLLPFGPSVPPSAVTKQAAMKQLMAEQGITKSQRGILRQGGVQLTAAQTNTLFQQAEDLASTQLVQSQGMTAVGAARQRAVQAGSSGAAAMGRMQRGVDAGLSYGASGAAQVRGKDIGFGLERQIAKGGIKGKLIKAIAPEMQAVADAISKSSTILLNAFKNPIGAIRNGMGRMRTAFTFSNIQNALSNGFSAIGSKLSSFGSILLNGFKHPIQSFKAFNAKMMAETTSTNKIIRFFNAIKIKGFSFAKAVTGIGPFNAAINSARASIVALQAQYAAAGAGAPGVFKMATAAVGGFTKGIWAAVRAMSLFKIAMVSTGVGAIVLAIAATVVYLIQVFQNMGNKSKTIQKNFSSAFKSIKEAISAIIKPIKDVIGTLVQMIGSALGGGDTTSEAFETISEKIADFAKAASEFVQKYVQPAIKMVMTWLLNFITSVVNVVKAVIAIFKGDWGKAFGFLKEALATIAKFFVNAWFWMANTSIEIFFGMASTVVTIFFGMLNKIVSMIADLAGNIVGLGESLLGWVPWLGDGIRAVKNWLHSIEEPFGSVEDAAKGVLDGIKGSIKGGLGEVQDFINLLLDKIGANQRDIIDGAGDDLIDSGKETGRELGEVITDPLGESLDEVIGGAGKKFDDLIKDLKQKFVDLVLDAVAGALDEAVDQMQSALEKQKDSALEVFNVQLETLDKLEKAEESLTKEKEYQANRRKLIEERELQRANYMRNRALAIYEGRIDDARVLGLQEQKDQASFGEELGNIDTGRKKDLAKENLDYLRESIRKAQEETEKMLDQQIEAFQNAAKEITKFPPLTIEEYEAQLTALNTVANDIAIGNGQILKDMMTSMKENLKMPNENVGVFTTGLDKLVEVAKNKYGLLSKSEDNTIIGATIGMLAGIEGQIIDNTGSITDAFSGVVDNVFDVAEGFKNISTEVIAPTLSEIEKIFIEKNPFDVFEKAIKDANETILREMQKTVGHVASLVDKLADRIDDAIVKLAILNQLKQDAENATGGGGGDSSGGGGGGGGDGAGPIRYRYFGGPIPKFALGGAVRGFTSQSVPALLHGGEYVVNAKAVRNIGYATLDALNNMKYATPGGPQKPTVSTVNETQNVNIYVDTFIGEDQWFESMMKEYNLKVVPRNQKKAGLESRSISTYSGINRGM